MAERHKQPGQFLAVFGSVFVVWLGLGCEPNDHHTDGAREDEWTGPVSETATAVRDLSPQEAKELLDRSKDCVYLDVRTEEEFAEMHISDTLNVPFLHYDPATGQTVPNKRFVQQVKASIALTTPVIVGCRSGGRSKVAGNALRAAGYRNLQNMLGGLAGSRNEAGDVVQEGWSALGYPLHRASGGRATCNCLRADHRKPPRP